MHNKQSHPFILQSCFYALLDKKSSAFLFFTALDLIDQHLAADQKMNTVNF